MLFFFPVEQDFKFNIPPLKIIIRVEAFYLGSWKIWNAWTGLLYFAVWNRPSPTVLTPIIHFFQMEVRESKKYIKKTFHVVVLRFLWLNVGVRLTECVTRRTCRAHIPPKHRLSVRAVVSPACSGAAAACQVTVLQHLLLLLKAPGWFLCCSSLQGAALWF